MSGAPKRKAKDAPPSALLARKHLSDREAAKVPTALVREAILGALGRVTLTFDGLCRVLDCVSTAEQSMVLAVMCSLEGRDEVLRVGTDASTGFPRFAARRLP